jgi:hypothetical protein
MYLNADLLSFYSFLRSLDLRSVLYATMGIQGLARRLEPYSNRYSAQELEGYVAIVDGPGLAYEAHKLALSAGASQTRIPSYAEINDEAMKWLNALEEQGIKV